MNLGRGLRARSNRWLVESLHRRIQGGKPWSGRAPRIQHEALVEGFHPIVRGRFLRQGKIFRNQEGEAGRPLGRPPHRCEESSTGYSSAGCSPAEPASASPAGSRLKFRGGVCQGRHELRLPLRTDRVMKKHHGLSAVTQRAPGTPSGRSARRGPGVFKKSLTEPTTL